MVKIKKHCPSCNSTRISDSKDYLVCERCGFIHQKTDREKIVLSPGIL